ncbi:MAG: hypothetical protein M1831_005860 [Alyxoria varia]|nr:MAG: hypothetical protein M1831_005860 [Alyxoria varia]
MATPSQPSSTTPPSPVCIVCVGMAGSGKTTFMQRINSHLNTQGTPPYILNLDPAVRHVPFEPNIDIRDSINYREVMSQYNLGPNGGIMTSLNLLATKVDQIVGILERRCGTGSSGGGGQGDSGGSKDQDDSLEGRQHPQKKGGKPENTTTTSNSESDKKPSTILIDTPGQIEVFVWSASGQILLSSLASSFPTVLAYIIDTPRTASVSTFMSNMLYACSILYKTKLPMILVFNKTDVKDAAFAKEWMTDFDAFQAALREEEERGDFTGEGQGSGYMGSLLNSMSLVLEEFYKHLSVVGVSSMTGHGVDEFFEAVQGKAREFERDYRPELERRRAQRDADDNMQKSGKAKEGNLGNLMQDLDVGDGAAAAYGPNGGGALQQTAARKKRTSKPDPETISDLEDNDDDDSEEAAEAELDPKARAMLNRQPESELVDPDAEPSDGEDGDGTGGGGEKDEQLRRRYRQAMESAGGAGRGNFTADDESFLRYVRSAKMG